MSFHRPFQIVGSGAALPTDVLDNRHFVETLKLDTTEDWILERTGIRERRIVDEAQSTATLAIDAAKEALKNARMSAEDLDLIIVATITPDTLTPSTASHVQEALGAKKAFSFDINNACSGFLNAIDITSRYLVDPRYINALIVGADVASRVIDYSKRDNCYFFGDGAGAVILQRSYGVAGLASCVHESLPNTRVVSLGRGVSRNSSLESEPQFLQMHGPSVKEFAISAFARLLGKSCERIGITPDELDVVVPHQANLRILEAGAKALDIPFEKVFVNLDRYGNTMSASPAIALHEYLQSSNDQRTGNRFVGMVAFGAGLVSAGCVLRV